MGPEMIIIFLSLKNLRIQSAKTAERIDGCYSNSSNQASWQAVCIYENMFMEPPKHFYKLIRQTLCLLSHIRSYLPSIHSKSKYPAIFPRKVFH